MRVNVSVRELQLGRTLGERKRAGKRRARSCAHRAADARRRVDQRFCRIRETRREQTRDNPSNRIYFVLFKARALTLLSGRKKHTTRARLSRLTRGVCPLPPPLRKRERDKPAETSSGAPAAAPNKGPRRRPRPFPKKKKKAQDTRRGKKNTP